MDQQFDIYGNRHDLAGKHERLKLFEPDVQLEGQEYMRLDEPEQSLTDSSDGGMTVSWLGNLDIGG